MKTFSSRDILNRLKLALQAETDKELADKLGLQNTTISNWRKRNSIDLPLVFSFCEHINMDWLLTGRGEMKHLAEQISNPITKESVSTDPTSGFNYVPPTAPTNEPELPLISHRKPHDRPFEHLMNPEKEPKRLPLVSVKAVGGFAGKDFSIKEQDIESYYVIPKFRNLDVDFLIEVIGDSMMPRLFPGDIIACSVIRNPNFIQWNKTYLIATDEQGIIVKRLKKSSEKGCLLAVSDNVDYDPFDIPMADIKGLARVVGVIHAD